MGKQIYLSQLRQNSQTIQLAVQNVPAEQARWRPSAEEWSILEVVNHLYDEERRDFRVRIDYTLNRPDEPWPPIDPAGWVVAEKYNERNLPESLENFLTERQRSIEWLKSLEEVDWDTGTEAPWGGIMRAGDLLASWAAHDLLHLRQINDLRYLYLRENVQPYNVEYAGEW
ncbi:MAG: DinB family protein [Chloroflexota bacterium]